MRSTMPLRAHAQSQDQVRTLSPPVGTPPQPESVPTIRLISAVPTAAGTAPGLGDPFLDTSITSSPLTPVSALTPLAPKEDKQAPRRRLVPKKSKLGLLVTGKRGKTPENSDLSDVVRRVGGSNATASMAKSGFEIHVDPTAQSEVGEVLMVKKKKSRAALSGLKWGTLAEVTNSSKDPIQAVGLKNEDKEKWWSIGRVRKDPKDMKAIGKENPRMNPSGAPAETLASRTRFNSLDSHVILGAPSKTAERPAQVRSASASESPLQDSDCLKDASHVPNVSCPIPEEPPLLGPPNTATGSIAIRAMRSMRSVARLANWTNGKSIEKDTTIAMPPVNMPPLKKRKQPTDTKKNKKTEKRKSDSGRDQMTSRLSGSSLEANAPTKVNTPPIQSSTVRKHGVLGLGFPSGLRFGTLRSSSAGSSGQISASSDNASSHDRRGRSSSTVSAASSLNPTSTKSRVSSSSSTPVKWVEERLETVKVTRRHKRIVERTVETQSSSNEVHTRGAIADMSLEHTTRPVTSRSTSSVPRPILTVEDTSVYGYITPENEPIATPRRQTRLRPASDQMTGKEQIGSIRHDPDGVLSALDAATNELASLISRLDLEATPTTPHGTLRLSPSFTNLLAESPRPKRGPHEKSSSMTLPVHPNMTSLTSLRPFPQSRNCEDIRDIQRCGQQIAPWPVSTPRPLPVSTHVPPSASSTSVSSAVAAYLPQECPTTRPERSFVSRPFWSAKSKKASRSATEAPISLSRERSPTQATACSIPTEPPSTKSRSMSKKKSVGVLGDSPNEFTLSRTFRKVMSTLSLSTNKGTELNFDPGVTGVPMSKEAQNDLGLAGTLGGSRSSRNPDQSMDLDDPDSDIPNELQVILTGDTLRLSGLEDTLTSLPPALTRRPPSPGLPPGCPLPIPVASHTSVVHSSRPPIPVPWMDDVQLEVPEESDSSSLEENDTKRSFDFTTELKRLSESAGSHRRSFMEQLESAFRTPAKYDLERFGQFGSYEDVPPVPPIPTLTSRHRLSDESTDPNAVASSPVSPLLPSPEIVQSKKLTGTMSSNDLSQSFLQKSPASSKPSYGELDLNFKFGGSPLSAKPAERSQLTLSDIIPPPAHARSLSMASVRENGPTQQSVSSSRCSKHEDSRVDACSSHSRASSQISFKGLESFDEIRRGFEFVENRPAFYPPPSSNQGRNQLPRDSMISIASVSSYGMVINPGVQDPFEYGYESRPASAEFVTMSTTVDDTFSFIRRGPRRKRVDSDASSFYFRAPGASRILRPLKSQFRRDSVMSTASLAPPVSIYSRSFGVHPGIDSASNICSGVQAYPAYGFAGGNRSSWAPSHRRDMSADSVMSDISMRIHRPTLGDKMLDSRHDYCLPLTSISASPPETVPSDYLYEHVKRRGSFDSIMDDEQSSYSRDSIMDQSNRRTSTTSESVFGQGGPCSMNAPLGQFRIANDRPFSLFSTEGDPSDFKREDDTMITMIGGGRIRRRSVASFVEGSPIFVRVGKRKAATLRGQQRRIAQKSEAVVFPNPAQKVERSPRGLGEERMVFARQGLLSRDSLEEHCLCADGVDTSFKAEPVFSRPVPASRSRSGTQSSTSSGLDTPSLSTSGETSSVASDSISSVDLSRVNLSLTNMSYPIIMQSRNRIRSKGHGHRRRLSGIQITRASVYETIEEENNTPTSDGFPDSPLPPVTDDNVIIVDPDDVSTVEWDERGIVALRKYYTLKDEVDVTIKESKQLWLDTPFSIYAVQSFEQPAHRSGMRALLEQSRETYGPLSAELRRIRSRTSSRPSPYPQPQRAIKISLSPSAVRPEVRTVAAPKPTQAPALSVKPAPTFASQPLQDRIIKNTVTTTTDVSSLAPEKNAKSGSGPLSQSRFSSNARRSAPGFTKRGIGKENQERDSSTGIMTAPNESLRLNRPRPRGRPAHARAALPIRI